MTKREMLAYLAGSIDSDGYIGVKKSTYAMRVTGDCKQPVYSERIGLKHIGSAVPDLLKATFGGGVGITRATAMRGRPLYSWQATDRKAAEACRALLPFLRVKHEQARNALALRVIKEKSKKLRVARGRGHAGSASRSPEMSAVMESAYLRAKELNAVGI